MSNTLVNKLFLPGLRGHWPIVDRHGMGQKMQSDDRSKEQKSEGKPSPNAGGFFLALGCIAGAIVGTLLGQPSMGFLAGLSLGGVIAVAIWYADRDG